MSIKDNTVYNYLRTSIVENLIKILRSHEKSDNQIKEMMLKD